MAIDPRLVSIKKVTDIPTVPLSELQTGQMFGYTGDGDLKKVATNDLLGFIKSGIKGIATQANAPTTYDAVTYPDGLFETYVVRTPLTMPNSWGSAVTQAELDSNYVYFDVKNGVISKVLSAKPLQDISNLAKKSDVLLKNDTLRRTGNIFNKDTVTSGKFVNYTNGNLDNNAIYSASEFIAIKPNTVYSINTNPYTAFYDENKVYISGYNITLIPNIFTTPINARFMRTSPNTSSINTVMILEGGVMSGVFKPYDTKGIILDDLIPDAFRKKDVKITSEDVNFIKKVYSTNLFDINSDKNIFGKYVAPATGNLIDNPAYNVAHISVIEGEYYTLSYKNNIAWFDSNGVYISGSASTDTNKTQLAPIGASYLLASVLLSDWIADRFRVNKGSVLLPYEPYSEKKLLDGVGISVGDIDIPKIGSDLRVFLPKEICIAVGRTIEIYHSQIIANGNEKDFSFFWSGVGLSMKRKWSCLGTTGKIGTYTLTLNIYNSKNENIFSGTTTVKIADATIVNTYSVCSIGDSLSNRKAWNAEVKSLGATKLNFVGTRYLDSGSNLGHEGRSGVAASFYLGNNSYTFDSNGINGTDGRTQNLNPFWNPSTSDVDFNYYKSNYGQNPNVLLIWLGTNGISLDPTINAGNIKTFIDKLKATGAGSIPIFVVHTLFRGDQNGIALQTGTDGYSATTTYKQLEDLKVFNLQEKMKADLKDYANVYLIPVSTCHDSEFNFGATVTSVNPRASQTELMPIEATHPQTQGYLQIADIMFSSFAVNLL